MRITLFFITGAIVFALGESLTCYECIEMDLNEEMSGSLLLKRCEQPFSSSNNTRNCNDSYYCSKIISSFNGTSFTLRQCLNSDLADLDPNNLPSIPIQELGTITAYFCKTDLCNSASLPTTTVSFLILFFLTLFLV